jgi:hypothetical protein
MGPTYNKSRGQSLFLNRVAELLNGRGNNDMLQQLAAHFADMVCVMPTDPDIKKLIEAGHPHFAAVRMADCCSQAANSPSSTDVQTAIREACKIYAASKPMGVTPVRPKTAAEQAVDNAFMQEIDNSDSAKEEIEMEIEDEDGNVIETKIIMADAFSMTQYADKVDLTGEGMRARGMLPSNFDPEDEDTDWGQVDLEEDLPEGIVLMDPTGKHIVILCPNCNKPNVYPDGSLGEYGCFNCDDVKFRVNVGLGDMLEM